MKRLDPQETSVTGAWIFEDGRIKRDAACQRIYDLIKFHLLEIGKDWSGWSTLYRDPSDGRYWELSYPQGEMHGGGPPQLTNIPPELARERFGIDLNGLPQDQR